MQCLALLQRCYCRRRRIIIIIMIIIP